MKRDIIAFSVGVCFLIISCLLAVPRVVPALSLAETSGTPTLILDAGHGGEDGGAMTASGHKESDINLSVVLRLESLMAFLGVDTILTRDRDISIHDPGCETLREKKVSDLQNRVKLQKPY